MCFADQKKLFDWVPIQIVKWAMAKIELPEVMMKVVMSLYKEATTKIKVGSSYSDEFPVKAGVQQGLVLLPFLFAAVIDVVTEVRKGLFHKIL